jgi:hypothetical protein
MYGWLAPSGELIDAGMWHEEAADQLGSTARDMAEEGYARVIIITAPGQHRRVQIAAGRPLNPSQQHTVRDILAQDLGRGTVIDLEAQGPDMDDEVLASTTSSDRVSLGKSLRAVNGAFGGRARTRTAPERRAMLWAPPQTDEDLYALLDRIDAELDKAPRHRRAPAAAQGRAREREDTYDGVSLSQMAKGRWHAVGPDATGKGFLLPDGTVVGWEGNGEHAAEAYDLDPERHFSLQDLQRGGLVRWARQRYKAGAGKGRADYIWVDTKTPLTSEQQRVLRAVVEEPGTEIILDGPGQLMSGADPITSPLRLGQVMRRVNESAAGRARERNEPEQRILAKYGTTDDPWSAGWILPDGTMVNLHRRRADRYIEHGVTAQEAWGGEEPFTGYRYALQSGWVRVMQGVIDRDLGFTLGRPLTEAQRRVVMEAATQAKVVEFDYDGPRTRLSSGEIIGAAPTVLRALRDLETVARQSGTPTDADGRARDRNDVEQRVIEKYGTTDDILQAGWMLPDGTLVDLKRRGSWDKARGWKEHREVTDDIFGQLRLDSLVRAEDQGWVRVMPSQMMGGKQWVSFEIRRPMTEAQLRVARRAAEEADEMAVSVRGDEGDDAWSSDVLQYGDRLQLAQALRTASREAERESGQARVRPTATPVPRRRRAA